MSAGEARPGIPWWRLVKLAVAGGLILAVLLVVYAYRIEPRWLAVRRLSIGAEPRVRLVHLSDIHYRGDRAYLERVVAEVNALAPDFACFTGDLVEEDRYLEEACEILRQLRVPLYAVPGNHDYWSGAPLETARAMCAATGGAWLEDEWVEVPGGRVAIAGMTGRQVQVPEPGTGSPTRKRLLLIHYPKNADELSMGRFDLVLAGHTHGGQVAPPLVGPFVLPMGTGTYDRGWHETPSGPLYVSPGVGTFMIHARFGCRPEIAEIRF